MLPSSAWEGRLAAVGGFIQRLPDDGEPATQATEAYFGYDTRALYVIFVAHDLEPKAIRARMEHREAIGADEDQVGIYIDTFRDRRRAYQFVCNPLGIQADSIYSEDADVADEGFDTLWQSHGMLTPGGYVVLMSIPFKSLRFSHETSQTWNIALWRFLGRRSEGSWWPRVSSRQRGILSQAAPARGMERISPGRNLQFTPYASWRAFHSPDDRSPGTATYVNRSAEMLAGFDAKAILKDSLVLDFTLRPDFSQVESDEPQISTNQRYELYYPEKRPFFTENANYFEVPMVVPSQHMLFTRRIADPDFGVRLTGRLGKYSIGGLVADDRSPGEVVPVNDPVSGMRAYFEAYRVTRDLPNGSDIGATYAERRFLDSYSRVADIDTTINLGRTWKATMMGGYNWSRNLDATEFSGGDLDATLTRVARGFNYIGYFVNRTPEFQPQMAYYDHSNWREIGQTFAYQFWPKNGWITRIWTEVYGARNTHYNGDPSWEGVKPMVIVDVRHNTSVKLYTWTWRESFGAQDFSYLHSVYRLPIVPAYGFQLSSTQMRRFDFKLTGEWGQRANVVPAVGHAPTEARYRTFTGEVSVRPSRGVSIVNTYLFDSNLTQNGESIYNSHVLRSKLNWQINRELSLRFTAQYAGVLSNSTWTATPTSRALNGDFLLTYLLHPGTALYLGYNSNLSKPGPGIAPADTNSFINDGRQVFVKVSYQFRF